MTHEHDFIKDLDGRVTCTQCGAMDDEKPSPTIQAIEKELTPLSKSQVRRITKVKSDELREKFKVTHEHDFIKDLDGQVTCSICGAMDDERVG